MRLAVYWTPEVAHPLWHAGWHWLGRDPDEPLPPPPAPDRRQAWRYGFHATLKPPLRLAPGVGRDALLAAVQAWAASAAPVRLPALTVGELGRFVALRLPETPAALEHLARDAVVALDRFRAPMPAAEHARRAAGLDDEQVQLLRRWGYPHVLQRWRFHMTLSDGVADDARRHELADAARRHFAGALAVPVAVRSISVFEEAADDQPLRPVARFALGG